MPTEAELREQFHEGDRPGGAIDLDAVLRRSRARRRPRVVATVLVSAAAALGIVIPVSVSGALGQPALFSAGAGSAASRADGSGTGTDSSGEKAPEAAGGSAADGPGVISLAPAQKVNLCTGTLAELAPAENGLVLSVTPLTASTTDRDIPATVTLTNTGSTAISGSASPYPSLTLSRDGIVLWHSNGAVPQLAQVIDLAPGASITLSTTFQPLVCGIADDERDSFRADLPAVAPGEYRLSAVMDVSTGAAVPTLVSGPAATVTLR